MIGVEVSQAIQPIVREFFQLFKTPWEFIGPGRQYSVLISTSPNPDISRAGLTIVYQETTCPQIQSPVPTGNANELEFSGRTLPIYCGITTFSSAKTTLLRARGTSASVLDVNRSRNNTIIHVGYALFSEIWFLLTTGQPFQYAEIPTLEHHIALLRELILRAGIPVIEIPPKPAGYAFIACLTHDIDHPLQSRHLFDSTMAGFLFRASLGSCFDLLRGRINLSKLADNFGAALQAPLLPFGLVSDRWSRFDQYLAIEKGLGATYFVIPQARYPGKKHEGAAPGRRASGYGVEDIREQLDKIRISGCEIGTHGLDAWIDAEAGRREQAAVARTTGTTASGVRMHWLYFDAQAPQKLESAGFSYDSTFGYNQTVGFRAGTVQAFVPPGTTSLMELPLHVMDTALFYISYLNLSQKAAFARVQDIIRFVATNSGVLTFNWHDRSLFPERLWGDVYQQIITELKSQGAWFPNACDAVRWFRTRRQAEISLEPKDADVEVRGHCSSPSDLPSLVLHVTTPPRRSAGETLAEAELSRPMEYPLAARPKVKLIL